MGQTYTQLPSRTIKRFATEFDLNNDEHDPVVIGSELVEFCKAVIAEFCLANTLHGAMKQISEDELFAMAVTFDPKKNYDLPQVSGRNLILLAYQACRRFMAMNGFEVTTAQHARDGHAWTPEEEAELEAAFDNGFSMDDLTGLLERSGNAIITRLCRLGRVMDNDKDGYKRVEKDVWVSYKDLATMKKHTGIKLK